MVQPITVPFPCRTIVELSSQARVIGHAGRLPRDFVLWHGKPVQFVPVLVDDGAVLGGDFAIRAAAGELHGTLAGGSNLDWMDSATRALALPRVSIGVLIAAVNN